MQRAGVLLLVLLLICGLGGWNCWRNQAADAAEFRPYRGISTQELDALIAAYEAEQAQAQRTWKRTDGRRPRRASAAESDLMAHLQDFERARRVADRRREAGQLLVSREADLARLRQERARRVREGTGWQRILRLATRI